jgi:hypothetical protein
MPKAIGGGVGGAATGAADRSTTVAGRRGCPPVNPSSKAASPTMAGMQSSATSWAWTEDHSAVLTPSCWTECSAIELPGTGLPWWPSPLANRNACSATSRTAPIRPGRASRITAESIAPITSRSSPAVGSGGVVRPCCTAQSLSLARRSGRSASCVWTHWVTTGSALSRSTWVQSIPPKGGWGSYSIHNWTIRAVGSSVSRATSAKARSIPAHTPAEVMTLPSSTHRSGR